MREIRIEIPDGIDFRDAVQYLIFSPLNDRDSVKVILIRITDDAGLVTFSGWKFTSLDSLVSNTSE